MKTIIFNFLIVLLFNNGLSLADGFENYLGKGDSFYKSFNFVAAIGQYEKAYAIAPNEFEVLSKLTRTYNDLSEEYYEKKDEKNAERSVNQGLKYAEEFYKKFPDSAGVYAYLAWSYGNLALYKGGNEKVKLAHKIKENAEESIRKNPNDYLPYIILGIYHRQIASLSWLEKLFAETFFGDVPEGTLEESEKYLLKALEIKPGVVIATFHLSLAYKEMGDEEKEIRTLRKVLDLPEKDFRDKYAKRKSERRLKELMD